VAHYAAEGLSAGEAVGLSGTRTHLGAIRGKLQQLGVEVETAIASGWLTLADPDEVLAAIAPGDIFKAEAYEAIVRERLETTRAEGRFSGTRWWGETTNRQFARNAKTAVRMEEIADRLAREYGATLFCSIACDRFDARAYDGIIRDVCHTHTHVIPARDYAAHRVAVNRAIADVVGDISGSLLQSLATWRGQRCELPSSQAILFWLREALPDKFRAVLERARQYDAGAIPEGAL